MNKEKQEALVTADPQTEQWGVFELTLNGAAEGNPFQEVQLSAHFSYKHHTIEVDGFYDGDGVYRVRFMPDVQGEWRYRTQSKPAGVGRTRRQFHLYRAACGQSWPRASRQYLSLRLRRRDALPADRHDLLCMEPARRRAGGADAGDAGAITLQQDTLLCLSQALSLQRERAGVVSISLSCQRQQQVDGQLRGRCQGRLAV
ncbi:MAG: DUF5060 domain-containing protein [Caldilinea sp.]|nr:DUF5060 domain-containing protein [Caldilinea sp.]